MIDMVHEHECLIFLFGLNERCVFYQMKPVTNICNVFFAHSAKASFVFPYFNQSLKFLQRFTVFNILRYHGSYLRSQESGRLDITWGFIFLECQKFFNEATQSSIQEYCGYTLKFELDWVEAGRRSLSSIEYVVDTL